MEKLTDGTAAKQCDEQSTISNLCRYKKKIVKNEVSDFCVSIGCTHGWFIFKEMAYFKFFQTTINLELWERLNWNIYKYVYM